MEIAINVQVERLPEGVYLATSEELQGLVAQGRTIAETLEIARDVARIILELRDADENSVPLENASDRRDYTIVVAA